MDSVYTLECPGFKEARERLERADFLSYLMFAHFLGAQASVCGMRREASLLEPVTKSREYASLLFAYNMVRSSSSLPWEEASVLLDQSVRDVYSQFKDMPREDVSGRDKEWFERYIPGLVADAGSCSMGSGESRLEFVRSVVLEALDVYAVRAGKKDPEALPRLQTILSLALSHEVP